MTRETKEKQSGPEASAFFQLEEKVVQLIDRLAALESRQRTDLAQSVQVADAKFLSVAGLAGTGQDEAALLKLAEADDLEFPAQQMIELRNARFPESHPRYWAIVNFDLHSSKERMFVYDVVGNTTARYLCAHGSGSEGAKNDGFPTVFSNKNKSKMSSLGIYRCAETYPSAKNGYSLKLDGLQSTNSRARSRKVVIHGAAYVSREYANKHKRIGRSEGCPALDRKYATTVIDQLKNGSFLNIWIAP